MQQERWPLAPSALAACICRVNPWTAARSARTMMDVATRLQSFSTAQRIALAAPPVLIISMCGVFQYLRGALGFPLGYLIAFIVYWTGWCGVLPALLLGRDRIFDLLAPRASFRSLDLRTRTLLLWPIVFALAFAFVPRIGTAGAAMLFVSAILGLVIGVTEEVLWRGVYVSLFGENAWLASIYPSLGFGLWHLCPLSVLPSRYPGGFVSFTAYSILLGLSYAYYARRARSIFWCTVSHCVHDALGLGGFVYMRGFP